jgi:hypothetical protein
LVRHRLHGSYRCRPDIRSAIQTIDTCGAELSVCRQRGGAHGDAVHAINPMYGQAANFAFEDATTLALVMNEHKTTGRQRSASVAAAKKCSGEARNQLFINPGVKLPRMSSNGSLGGIRKANLKRHRNDSLRLALITTIGILCYVLHENAGLYSSGTFVKHA